MIRKSDIRHKGILLLDRFKLWNGKKVFDENGLVQISVIKGFSNPENAEYSYEVDGLSGATITSKGVSNLLAFWLGNEGFGPFINNLKNKANDLKNDEIKTPADIKLLGEIKDILKTNFKK